jgi:hypothetical protein
MIQLEKLFTWHLRITHSLTNMANMTEILLKVTQSKSYCRYCQVPNHQTNVWISKKEQN